MKFVSFKNEQGHGFGVIEGDQVVDLSRQFPNASTLRQLIASVSLTEVRRRMSEAPRLQLTDAELLPPIVDAGKIFCVGVNYADHRAETGRTEIAHPTIFTRFNDTHVGHGSELRMPRGSASFDYEGELAIVIGTAGTHISEENAWQHVFGFSVYNDGTEREWQRHSNQWIPGKNLVESGAFGPWLVTVDEVPDIANERLVTRVDGEERQNAKLGEMIFGIPALIHYISGFSPLDAGDVIVTGTPGGVGMARTPPTYLKVGQRVEVEITGVGVLSNVVGFDGGAA